MFLVGYRMRVQQYDSVESRGLDGCDCCNMQQHVHAMFIQRQTGNIHEVVNQEHLAKAEGGAALRHIPVYCAQICPELDAVLMGAMMPVTSCSHTVMTFKQFFVVTAPWRYRAPITCPHDK